MSHPLSSEYKTNLHKQFNLSENRKHLDENTSMEKDQTKVKTQEHAFQSFLAVIIVKCIHFIYYY